MLVRMKKAQICLLLVFAAFGALAACSSNSSSNLTPAQLYDPQALPSGSVGKEIAYGHELIVNTQKELKPYVTAQMSCAACHINGGTQPRGGSFRGTYAAFPQWNSRAKRVIALQDRLTECFLYSMNGHPPAYSSREMIAMVAYIAWISRGVPTFSSPLPEVKAVVASPASPPSIARGGQIYAQKCSVCHQANGAGLNTASGDPGAYPPLWGPTSFNNKAGMSRPARMVPFIYYNMPANAPGTLSQQDAYDVAAFILSHPRPKFQGKRPVTYPALPARYF